MATPNRNFPIDPHTLLPFYHFLTPSLQRRICRFSPGYLNEYEPIDLLSERDLLRNVPRRQAAEMRAFPFFQTIL